MSVLIFVLVLVVLILVHEFGHFVAAKWSGMRVDEFGIGYPPRVVGIQRGETMYSINALPFGGFVKIYGEDGAVAGGRAFSSRPRILQAIVLLAGILMNVLFAYLVLVGALMAGTPRALTPEELGQAHNVQLAAAYVLPDSPAEHAGILPADTLVKAEDSRGAWQGTEPKAFTDFIAASQGEPITLTISRAGEAITRTVVPTQGIVTAEPDRFAVGISVAPIGIIRLPLLKAVREGAALTWGVTRETAIGLTNFFVGVVTLHADLSQVSGPVGIAKAVGAASNQGFGDLLSLAAIISINLALINLLPFPALDGGRLLFVIIESVIRRPIQPRIAYLINATGFALLLLLMVVVTIHDIARI